jgi:tRNA (guanine-N7-)-methyltransferase
MGLESLPKGFCSASYDIVSNQGDRLHPRLGETLDKHCNTPYLRPVRDSFRVFYDLLYAHIIKLGIPVILDAGCGTGYSTCQLATDYPDHLVIGVDRSDDRLCKSGFRIMDLSHYKPGEPIFIHADCVDLYLMLHERPLPIKRHYLLYPNPYPKAAHLKRRWHAHPVFHKMLAISPYHEWRSNWLLYLKECQYALHLIDAKKSTRIACIPSGNPALTLFERKYHVFGQSCYVLSAS